MESCQDPGEGRKAGKFAVTIKYFDESIFSFHITLSLGQSRTSLRWLVQLLFPFSKKN